MGGVSVDLLFLLVLIFKASCKADVDFSNITCKDVTGHVGKELTLNCTVIYSNRCRAVLYKFKDKDTTICRENCTSKSNQHHFSCSYTPNEDVTSTFLFFLQANCGIVKKEFTVNTAGGSSRIHGDPTKETSLIIDYGLQLTEGKAVIVFAMAGISCFIICVMGFVLIRKLSFGFLKNCVVCDDEIKKHPDKETV